MDFVAYNPICLCGADAKKNANKGIYVKAEIQHVVCSNLGQNYITEKLLEWLFASQLSESDCFNLDKD